MSARTPAEEAEHAALAALMLAPGRNRFLINQRPAVDPQTEETARAFFGLLHRCEDQDDANEQQETARED